MKGRAAGFAGFAGFVLALPAWRNTTSGQFPLPVLPANHLRARVERSNKPRKPRKSDQPVVDAG